jgi:hypothetical protein
MIAVTASLWRQPPCGHVAGVPKLFTHHPVPVANTPAPLGAE